ncbi:MAG TPA: GNAT family N-acetyltransferase [Limnochordia bacterium]|nr:GNAT family N-acetyltransferase [Limnochordia bacterium]
MLACLLPGLEIQRLTLEDLEGAGVVFEQSISSAFQREGIAEDAPAEIEFKKGLLRSSLQEGSSLVFFVAKLAGRVIGTISFGPCGEDIRKGTHGELAELGELGSIYVLPEFQGRGVASALIAAMAAYLDSQGVREFTLDCGLKEAQQKWRQKFGQPFKVVKDYWGQGADHFIWLCRTADYTDGRKTVYLQDRELVIRTATMEDAPQLCQWWNDGKVMKFSGFPMGLGLSIEDVQKLLAGDDHSQGRLILEVDNQPVGEMNYRSLDGGTAQIGIKICSADMRGRGYGTRFLRLLIGWLFGEKGYARMILDTNVKNTRAQHVYEKLGFRKTGTRIDCWRDQLGELQSFIDYELTPEDFNRAE